MANVKFRLKQTKSNVFDLFVYSCDMPQILALNGLFGKCNIVGIQQHDIAQNEMICCMTNL